VPAGLIAGTSLGSTPGMKGSFFSSISLMGHVLRLNSRKGTEDLPVSSCQL